MCWPALAKPVKDVSAAGSGSLVVLLSRTDLTTLDDSADCEIDVYAWMDLHGRTKDARMAVPRSFGVSQNPRSGTAVLRSARPYYSLPAAKLTIGVNSS